MMPFSNLLLNVYFVFLLKLIVITKRSRFNQKQIEIIFEFVYTENKIQRAKFKSVILNMKLKTNKSSTESHRWFILTFI